MLEANLQNIFKVT